MSSTTGYGYLSGLLASGWKVVGFAVDRQPSLKDDQDWNSQVILVQKDSQLRSYEFLFDGKALFTMTERDLTSEDVE